MIRMGWCDVFEQQLISNKVNQGKTLHYSKAAPLPLPSVSGLMHEQIQQERNNGLSVEDEVSELKNDEDLDHARQKSLSTIEVSLEDEIFRKDQAAIKIQRAFRKYLVRFFTFEDVITQTG